MSKNQYLIIAILAVILSVGVIGFFQFMGGQIIITEQNDDTYQKASLLGFTSTGGKCVDNFNHNVSTELDSTEKGTYINITQNIAVNDSNYVLSTPKINKTGPQNYTLYINSYEETQKSSQNCTAQIRYTTNLQLPYTEDQPFILKLKHDSKKVGHIRNGEDSSGGEMSTGIET